MGQTWTTDLVLALAPDASSASAGQGLANPRKWSALGRSDRAVWGLCQGSGKDPYQTRVDLSAEPAFKCSCPSRKFPCKHGLGLMLLLARDEKSFATTAEPGWVADWIASRQEKAEKKAERAEARAAAPVDAEAQAKRRAQRETRIQDGLAECRGWLEDLVRRGLAAAQSESNRFWEQAAARMVDAQAPGLAASIRRIADCITSGEGWQVRTLDAIGRLHLLVEAGRRITDLPADLATDVRTALGWPQNKEEALASPAVADRWVVLGQIIEEEQRLRTRRTWLLGRATGRRALLLDFAAAQQPFEPAPAPGTEFDGELAFFPSRAPLCALVKASSPAATAQPITLIADASIHAALTRYAQAIALNPWIPRWPVALAGARLAREGDRWSLVDAADTALPIRPGFARLWRLIAITGGAPADIAGEWDGEWFTPLSTFCNDAAGARFEDVAPRWAA